MKNVDKFPLS